MSGGPALIDLVMYFVAGYVLLPTIVVITALKNRGDSTRTVLFLTALAILISSPIAYRVTGVVHLPVLGVLNLAVGPALGLLLAISIAYIGEVIIKNPK